MRGRIEQALEDAGRFGLEAIAREAKADQRIVVRPDRAVVVRHRVIARLALRDRADAPAAERLAAHQRVGGTARPLRIRNAREERMAGVRGANAAGPLGAIERERIGADIRAPERLLELIARRCSASLPSFDASVRWPSRVGNRREGALGRVDVALHLAERDRPLRQRAVGMEDGVVGVLPALVGKAAVRLAVVLDEAIPVAVAVLIDPAQRRLDVGPDLGRVLRSPVRSKYIPASMRKSGVASTVP